MREHITNQANGSTTFRLKAIKLSSAPPVKRLLHGAMDARRLTEYTTAGRGNVPFMAGPVVDDQQSQR
jgi:hypothetical protein